MQELFAKQVPSSLEAEQAVIGSILIDSRCAPEVVELLRADDFYQRHNREIFETICSMFGFSQVIDPITVLDAMKSRGVFEDNVTREYMLQLMEITPTAANVMQYARIVKDKALLRSVLSAAEDITGLVLEGQGAADEILEAAEQKIFAIRQGRAHQGLFHIGAVLVEVYDRLIELSKNAGQIPGIPTGIAEIDSMISGLNNSDLILIASRPGMGKTSIALNIALNAAKKAKKAVVVFSLEMSREQLGLRLVSSESFIDSKKLQTGDLSDSDWENLLSSSTVLSKLDLRMDDNPAITVNEMKAKCRRVENLGLIIIDYLQLMQGSKRTDNRSQEVSEISRGLKIMAKELNVPVLCLSQLSRANESRGDKRPMLSDLRESGAIEQDADIVMFLYRDSYYNKEAENPNEAECIVAKNRHGETGTVTLEWIGRYTTFSSREWKHND